ncbi:uncharacterized protein V1516DRAFT_672528 [Lipomyces oligophaga]|uniref:uncharacterized protein n=1 Tax=Lipomyces oligophaga TaxID=45792 RepID=UPI0034CEC06B
MTPVQSSIPTTVDVSLTRNSIDMASSEPMSPGVLHSRLSMSSLASFGVPRVRRHGSAAALDQFCQQHQQQQQQLQSPIKIQPSSSTVSLNSVGNLTRTASGIDITSLPEAEQMSHMVKTLKTMLRRCANIRRKMEEEDKEFAGSDHSDEAIAQHDQQSKKLATDLRRAEAFAKHYKATISQLSELSWDSVEIPGSVATSPLSALSPTDSPTEVSMNPIFEL